MADIYMEIQKQNKKYRTISTSINILIFRATCCIRAALKSNSIPSKTSHEIIFARESAPPMVSEHSTMKNISIFATEELSEIAGQSILSGAAEITRK